MISHVKESHSFPSGPLLPRLSHNVFFLLFIGTTKFGKYFFFTVVQKKRNKGGWGGKHQFT